MIMMLVGTLILSSIMLHTSIPDKYKNSEKTKALILRVHS